MVRSARRFLAFAGRVTNPAVLRSELRGLTLVTAAYAAAAICVLGALVFAVIAAYAGLRTTMPAWAAALVMSAALLLLAAVVVLIGRLMSRRATRARYMMAAWDRAPGTAGLFDDAAPLVDEALRTTRERPFEAILTAVLAGLVTDRFLRKPPRDGGRR